MPALQDRDEQVREGGRVNPPAPHTILEVLVPTYDAIVHALRHVGFDLAIEKTERGVILNMHGIGLAKMSRTYELDAAEMFGEIVGRYRDVWPDVCVAMGLPDCDISFVSLTAVLDAVVERTKATRA